MNIMLRDVENKLKGMVEKYRVLQKRHEETCLRNEQLLQENKQLQKRQKEMNRNLQNTEDQQTNNKQRQPDIKIINEGWGILFGQTQERIMNLMDKDKKNKAELKEMAKSFKTVTLLMGSYIVKSNKCSQ